MVRLTSPGLTGLVAKDSGSTGWNHKDPVFFRELKLRRLWAYYQLSPEAIRNPNLISVMSCLGTTQPEPDKAVKCSWGLAVPPSRFAVV